MRDRAVRSFTLIELVIVITILAIIAAAAIPLFQNIQRHAKIQATKALLGQARSGIHIMHMKLLLCGFTVGYRDPEPTSTYPQRQEIQDNCMRVRPCSALVYCENLWSVVQGSYGPFPPNPGYFPEPPVAPYDDSIDFTSVEYAGANRDDQIDGSGWKYDPVTGDFFVDSNNPAWADENGLLPNQW